MNRFELGPFFPDDVENSAIERIMRGLSVVRDEPEPQGSTGQLNADQSPEFVPSILPNDEGIKTSTIPDML